MKKNFEVTIGKITVENCGLPCDGMFYFPEEVRLLRLLIGAMACAGTLFSMITVLTVLIDWQRFQAPERPVFWLMLNQFTISVTYIVGFSYGNDASCYQRENVPPGFKTTDFEPLITQSYSVTSCTIMAMVLYFCFLSSSVWWVNLTIAWYLSTGQQWGPEAIQEKDGWFQFFAWIIPSVMVIVMLVSGYIDGDVLTGTNGER